MKKFKVTFSLDPTGFAQDITDEVVIADSTCLYCLHDKESRFLDVIKLHLELKGYDLSYYFQIMKIY